MYVLCNNFSTINYFSRMYWAHCTRYSVYLTILYMPSRKEAKINFCLTPIVVMRKLSEWNSFVLRIESLFSLSLFLLLQQNIFETHFELSIEELHRKYFDNELYQFKWDYVQSLREQKDKTKNRNRKYTNTCFSYWECNL